MTSTYDWLIRRITAVLAAKGALRRYLLCALVFAAAGMPIVSPARAFAPVETVSVHELPREAQVTLDLIRRGGPFPYRRDGIEFQNRERRLPPRPRGYYHEYTVVTPGARDRGASRIIAGDSREYYFSADHYRSFRRVVP